MQFSVEYRAHTCKKKSIKHFYFRIYVVYCRVWQFSSRHCNIGLSGGRSVRWLVARIHLYFLGLFRSFFFEMKHIHMYMHVISTCIWIARSFYGNRICNKYIGKYVHAISALLHKKDRMSHHEWVWGWVSNASASVGMNACECVCVWYCASLSFLHRANIPPQS